MITRLTLVFVLFLFITPAFAIDSVSCQQLLATPPASPLEAHYWPDQGARLACAKLFRLPPYSDLPPAKDLGESLARYGGNPTPPVLAEWPDDTLAFAADNWTIFRTPSGNAFWNFGGGYISGPGGLYVAY